jgi:hypothetical protein
MMPFFTRGAPAAATGLLEEISQKEIDPWPRIAIV